jgi:GNAT superfamily N-acetyltransferase
MLRTEPVTARSGKMSAMPAADRIEIRRLGATELPAQLDGLAAVLADCVAGGASVSYLAPFSHEQARAEFEAMAAEAEKGRRLILAAFADGQLVGTVQVILALPPNQPHRAEIAKLLVHRSARKRGIAQLLMEQAESEARVDEGRRDPRLRPLPGPATLRHDLLLEDRLGRPLPRAIELLPIARHDPQIGRNVRRFESGHLQGGKQWSSVHGGAPAVWLVGRCSLSLRQAR